ncbi:hypothetical protein L5515_009696 [Caenorhabditis briggsae]|uniref:Uncharacterized protein n=1 Tax=Caenorhabditis briggsae TaxID=6238 RepID=A0AAE9JP16_CAEBR|nr:hypothetical protein L5515_009696 [Caenorhabditis briggsae]
MTENDKKSSYFSNGDFEKVAADIISSPRRLKHSAEDSLFKITSKQQEYYTKCFRHLIKTTQGVLDLSGALHGADQRIVAFFRRSSLDMTSLSKIWSLADVNEDGWLDLQEFSIAMHLVVLKVKGEVPIPDVLPVFARPPITEPRGDSRVADVSPTVSVARSEGKNWTNQPIIKQFSNTPPLLVDSRPTAIKHSALLALKSPLGPPPEPPARPQQRGHNRSASLDLKLISLNKNSGKLSEAPPTTLSLWSSHSDPTTHPSSISTTTTTTTFASFPATPDSIPPPIPQRITPSPLPVSEMIFFGILNFQKHLKIQKFRNSEIQEFGNSEFQKFNKSKIQKFRNSEIQKFRNSEIQKFRNSKVQKFKNSKIQKFKNSKIQKFKNSKNQRF